MNNVFRFDWLTGRVWVWGLLLALLTGPARAQTWQTAAQVGPATNGFSVVTATTTDASGNVYVVGNFSGTVVFGNVPLTSAGDDDVFVAKWNRVSGVFVWAQRAGGTDQEIAFGVAVNGPNVYVAGSFGSALAAFGTTALASAGSQDVFVAKLTDAGTSAGFVWAQRAGSTGPDQALALAVNGPNLYVTGQFVGTAVAFGPVALTSAGGSDAFVAKLVDAGATAGFVWAQSAGGLTLDALSGVTVSGPDVYVAGSFNSSTLLAGNTTLVNAGGSDAFVAKLVDAGAAGSFVWAQRGGGSGEDFAEKIAVSGPNVYIAGSFESAAASFGATTLAGAGQFDVFVAKLVDAGAAGSFVWAQRAGGPADEQALALAANGPNVYVAGLFEGSNTAFGANTVASAGGLDGFVAKLVDAGATGSFTWAQRAGGATDDALLALAVRGATVYVGGGISGTAVDFGTIRLTPPPGATAAAVLAGLADATGLGIERPVLDQKLVVSPNPAHTATTVRVPSVPGATTATLTLLDALGRPVLTQQLALPAAGARAELSVAGLAPGFYHLRVQAGGQRASRALAVE